MNLPNALWNAVCVLLAPVLLFSSDLTANGEPVIDEGLYCWGIYPGWDGEYWGDDKIDWGPRCGVKLQCDGFANGSVGIEYPIFEKMHIDWGFEYIDPDNGSYTPTLCEGSLNFYPVETPHTEIRCGGSGSIKITINLSGCDWDWVKY